MKRSELIKRVNNSNLDEIVKAVLCTMLERQAKENDETIWIMPNSEWRGLPMSELPESYIRASLHGDSKSYIRQPNYREMLEEEAAKRGLNA